MIVDENNNIVYVPPDFLREKKQSRKKLQELCDEFNLLTSRDLNAIIKYETEIGQLAQLNRASVYETEG